MTMLAFVVYHLHQPAPILGAVRRLGERHVHYGVQPHHYATVGAALLWTLAQHFGPAFTPDMEAAWAAAYQFAARTASTLISLNPWSLATMPCASSVLAGRPRGKPQHLCITQRWYRLQKFIDYDFVD